MILSAIILIPFFILNDGFKKVKAMGIRVFLSLLGIGVVLAVHFASWITSLSMTSVASSVILVHIDPIFVIIVSHYLFEEKITNRTILGIIIALAGATIIAVGDTGLGERNIYGDILALIGGIMLGIYILSGRLLRQKLDLTSYVTPVYAFAAFFLIIGSILSGKSFTGYPLHEYLLFLLLAIIPMIFGHTVYNWVLKYVTAPVVSISLLGEPVAASFLAIFFLGEFPSTWTIIGGVITMIGILICVYRSS
jgi:drug/metabolite transporter (DMT)-like permease